jgi:hypothetical protein
LITPPADTPRQRDDLDDMMDDLFGKPIPQKPGPLDAALSIGGVALILAGALFRLGAGLLAAGVICLILGLSLPATNLWRLANRKRAAERLRSTLRQGEPLNLNDPTMQRLASGYMQLQEMRPLGDPLAEQALEASHEALLEVSSLLNGHPPRGAAELEYVARRADAVEKLVRSIVRSAALQGQQADAEAGATRGAVVSAISDFEKRTGLSSLIRLDSLQAVIDQESKR